MVSSKTEIWNIAMSHLGTGKEIANENEASEEARACRRMWSTCLDKVLRDAPWRFAARIEDAQLIEAEPNDEWAYSYRYPTDCILLRRVLSGSRNDSRQSRISFLKAGDATGTIFYTDAENAQIEVTYRHTDYQFWPASVVLAASYKLAALVSPKLTKGDPFKMKQDMERLYMMALAEAAAEEANEDQPDVEVESEFIRARD